MNTSCSSWPVETSSCTYHIHVNQSCCTKNLLVGCDSKVPSSPATMTLDGPSAAQQSGGLAVPVFVAVDRENGGHVREDVLWKVGGAPPPTLRLSTTTTTTTTHTQAKGTQRI